LPSTVTWINPGGADWDVGSNWSTGTTPGAGDDVIVNQPGNIVVTHTQNVTDTIHSLTTSDTLTLSAGALDANTVNNAGTVTVGSGSMLAVNDYIQSGGTTRLQGGTLGALLPPESMAPSFDGGGFVRVPSASSLNPTSQLTVEAWINPSSLNNPLQGIAGTWDDLTGNNRSYLLWVQFGKVAFYVSHDGANFPSVVSTTTLQPDQWYHVAGTFDGTNLRLYVNGSLEATQASPGPVHANSQPFFIGRVDGGGNGPTFFDGQIADVRLWDVARSQSDIQANRDRELSGSETGLAGYWPLSGASGGTVLDQTTNQNNGTLSGTAAAFDPVHGGGVDIQGGTLTGPGTINADLTNAGEVDPGGAPGILTVRGNYTQTATGVLGLRVGGTTPGTQFDQLNVSGGAALDGTLNVSLIDGFSPIGGQTFDVFNFGSASGGFATANFPTADGVTAFKTAVTPNGLDLVGATVPPTSTVNPLPAFSPPSFTVSWTGQDNPGGSGVAYFDIYVSDNGAPFVPFVTDTTNTSATFTGQRGHSYGFFSAATDRVGNREATPAAAEATTTVPTQVSTTTTLASSAPSGSTYGQNVTFTASVSADLPVFGTPTGSVQFQVGGANLGSPVALTDGTASLTTSALSAGQHVIAVTYTSDSGDFAGSGGGPLSQDVAPAVLTVTADNQAKVYGAALPVLTASYSGFVNGDTAAVLSGAPGLSTSATAASDVGTYAIAAGPGTLSAANYTLTFVNGTLTVTAASTATAVVSSVDPSVFAQPVTFTATVDPGAGIPTGSVTFFDGTTALATVPLTGGSASYTTEALERGSHAITAVYGGDGNFLASTSAALIQAVQTVALEPDPLDPGKKDLVVGGTSGDDRIDIQSEHHGKRIEVKIRATDGHHFRFENEYAAAGLARVIVFGGPGNDVIRVDPGVTLPALLFGGGGDDVLIGGGGPSVLVGGPGSDVLIGGRGRNILIGGAGPYLLLGRGRGDILIGGSTDYDANVAALCALMEEWGRTDVDYHTRISHLTGPGAGGSAGGLNRPYYLNPATVHDDGAENVLLGVVGRDWFFAGATGRVLQLRRRE
jgi:hypothetical protein